MLLNSLFIKVDAIVILSLSSFLTFFRSSPHRDSFSLYNLLFSPSWSHTCQSFNLHSSTCPIRHLLWLSVSCSGWDYTVQGSSPHKCGQKSCCSALNAVVTVFLLDISAFLSPSYILEVHPYRWKFLEGRLRYLSTCLSNAPFIRVVWPSRTVTSTFFFI